MSKELVEKKSFDYFQSGYCCSEAICQAVVEHFGDQSGDIAKVGSAFCGGIGGTHEEVCGTFTGGLIAIGWLLGRTAPGQELTVTKQLATEFMASFSNQFGSINCRELLDKFGEQDNGIECKRMTADAAGILFDLIDPII